LIFFLRQPCWVASAFLNAVFDSPTQSLCYLKYLFYLLSYIIGEKKGLVRQKKGLVRQKKGLVRQKKGLVRQKERFSPSKERLFVNYFFIYFIFTKKTFVQEPISFFQRDKHLNINE
jgi:hypothetical protein